MENMQPENGDHSRCRSLSTESPSSMTVLRTEHPSKNFPVEDSSTSENITSDLLLFSITAQIDEDEEQENSNDDSFESDLGSHAPNTQHAIVPDHELNVGEVESNNQLCKSPSDDLIIGNEQTDQQPKKEWTPLDRWEAQGLLDEPPGVHLPRLRDPLPHHDCGLPCSTCASIHLDISSSDEEDE